MRAAPLQPQQHWTPDPTRQRLADHTLQDLLELPEEAPDVDLIDGRLLMTPYNTAGHQDRRRRLCTWLFRHAPDSLHAVHGMTLALGPADARSVDVLLVRADLPDRTRLVKPRDVTLVAEVEAAETRATDRLHKPAEFADAGIPYYWRLEQEPLRLFAYRLGTACGADGHRRYELVAESGTVLELTEPFPIRLNVGELGR
jgi:Uma2 family endonuclease